MAPKAAYDEFADWYEDYITGPGAWFTGRVDRMLGDLLGPGAGRCLDVCCGTGVHAARLRALGWTPLGVDLSLRQLRYAWSRLPVVAADAEALPVGSGTADAAVCVLGHTDVSDYAAVLREIARALRPGGRFVHLGIHPCFCGAFADRSRPERIVLGPGYGSRERSFEAWSPDGVRVRVGARHLPLEDLIGAVLAAGLVLNRLTEDGRWEVPDILGIAATKPE